MKTTGIICEYNPFHSGHKYQLDFVRKNGAECIICVLSGNFTQRGEFAVADKYTRAKAALAEGADIVVELPFPYCSMSAEGFANAGVFILSCMGADTICFGFENERAKSLFEASEILTSDEFTDKFRENKNNNKGSASNFFELLGKSAKTTDKFGSNDILGIAYIRACRRFCPDMNILPLKRSGSDYLSTVIDELRFPSATALRKKLYDGQSFCDFSNALIPQNALEVYIDAQKKGVAPVSEENISQSILSFFRLLDPDAITTRAVGLSRGGKAVADDGSGILNRLCKAASQSKSYSQFLNSAFNSKYTNSRIRRVILFSLCGVSDAMYRSLPVYTTLLAANQTGCRMLATLRKDPKLNIVTKPSHAPSDTGQYRLSEKADALFSMAMPSVKDSGVFLRHFPTILNE